MLEDHEDLKSQSNGTFDRAVLKTFNIDPKTESGLSDTGARTEFDTGCLREPTTGKGAYHLLPPYALFRFAQHMQNGAAKYAVRNWEKGMPLSRYLDSALRHTFQYIGGDRSEDHMAAALWNIGCMIDTQERIRQGKLPAELDDLPTEGTYS